MLLIVRREHCQRRRRRHRCQPENACWGQPEDWLFWLPGSRRRSGLVSFSQRRGGPPGGGGRGVCPGAFFAPPTAYRDGRHPCMLDGIGDRLGGDVVHGGFERRFVSPVEGDVEVDGDRASASESLQCVVESRVGENRGMDAARDLARLSAFATAVATSSANLSTRLSVFGGKLACELDALSKPQSSPSTTIGAPTIEK